MIRYLIVALFGAGILGLSACTPSEGERCNPLLFSDECGAGHVCTIPTNCVVAFCCPTSGKSDNPNCQACPAPGDGGTD